MADVYCSTKFKDLMVHVQGRLLYNCCKALPERIDLDWLEKNPGKLFYTPTMIADRQSMIEGKRTNACEHGCYKYEDQGLTSSRANSSKEEIIDLYNPLQTLIISMSTDCNLTCAYCSPEWSTAWFRDIDKKGEYDIEGYKNKNDNWAELWNKIKQKNRSTETRFFKLLLKEISFAKQIKSITIVGGEPLLNNKLAQLVESIQDKKIFIISGVGLKPDKFKKCIDSIKHIKNLSFKISAETTGSNFEFIRYGITWNDFLDNITYLKNNNIKFSFLSTVTNLTSFDIVSFYDVYGKDHGMFYNPVTERTFLQPNVLDDLSKEQLINSIDHKTNDIFFSKLKTDVSQPYDDVERKKLSLFLIEFSKRRNLKLDIFPKHFLKWLEII